MVTQTILTALAGGLLCLDRILVQAMVSRPIVVSPVIGFLLGDPATGLMTGLIVELLWIDRIAIGAYVPPNDTLVAILLTAVSIWAGDRFAVHRRELLALSACVLLPLGWVTQRMDRWIIRTNDRLAHAAVAGVERGDFGIIARMHLWGLAKYFLCAVTFLLVFLPLGFGAVSWLYPRLGAPILRGLLGLYYFLPALGVVVALKAVQQRGSVYVFSIVYLLLVAVQWVLHG